MWTGDDEMEDVLYLTIMGVCGALFMYLGWLIWIKEKINLIHDYHYKKVKESDKKAYTAVMGKATMLIGAGTVLDGIICIFLHLQKGGTVFTPLFAVGLVMMIYAQIKYNHGIF